MCNIFGERLLEERKRLGLTQDEMAMHGGVAKRTYCNYEAGEREPPGGFLSSLAAFGLDVQYILTGVRMTIAPYAQAEPAAALSARERALLDNYRHCSEEAQGNIDKTSALLAQQKAKRKMR